MEKLWNGIVRFFTISLPGFFSENWLIIDSILLGIIVIAFIIGLVRHKKINKLKRDNAFLTETITVKDTLIASKANHIGTLMKEKDELERCLVANKTDYENELCTKEAEYKGMCDDYEKTIDELNKEIDSLEADKTLIQVSLDELVIAKTDLDNEHLELLDKNSELNRAVLSYAERYEELEKKYNSLLIENGFLKNYEVENKILIKTLRKLREDDETEAAKTKDAIVALESRINKKIDATFEAMTSKIVLTSTKFKNLDEDLSSLKRSELSKIAKKLGITVYATWSNERLIEEIKKYKI